MDARYTQYECTDPINYAVATVANPTAAVETLREIAQALTWAAETGGMPADVCADYRKEALKAIGGQS